MSCDAFLYDVSNVFESITISFDSIITECYIIGQVGPVSQHLTGCSELLTGLVMLSFLKHNIKHTITLPEILDNDNDEILI